MPDQPKWTEEYIDSFNGIDELDVSQLDLVRNEISFFNK